jgi:hypothetical protein
MLWLLSVAVLLAALLKESQERVRALGLLSFIGAAASLILVIGRARAGLGEEYAFIGTYMNMVLPALCCVYLTWIVYGRPAMKTVVQVCLFTGACLFFLPNLGGGIWVGRFLGTHGQALAQDIRAGVPPFILAERHIRWINAATGDVKGTGLLLRQMQQTGMPQFRHMAPDPVFREVALPVAPIAMNQVIWHKGVFHSRADDPRQAALDFALTEPRFVYAIRLKIRYGTQASGWAAFRMSWENSGRVTSRSERVSGCDSGVGLDVETIPHGMWDWRYRADPQKTLTIWINSTIDGFRVCPDTTPFSFAVSEVTLLVP